MPAFFGYIFELIISFVDIEPATRLVCGKENIFQPIIIKIADTNPATHISKFVDE